MEFYYLVYIICISFTFLMFSKKSNIHKVFIFISYAILLVISILRVDIGTDYKGHFLAYNGISNSLQFYEEKYTKELFFYLICKVCGKCNLDFKWVVGIISFITIYPIYKMTNKNNYFFIISLFISAFYLTGFSLMRQFASVSLLSYACYKYYRTKKSYISLFLLATLMHTSAVIFIFGFILANKIYKLDLFSVPLYSIFLIPLAIFLGIIIKEIMNNLLSSYTFGYLHYLTSSYDNSVSGIGFGVLLRYISYAVLVYLNNFSVYSTKETKGQYNVLLFILVFVDVNSCFIDILLRMRFVFYPVLFYFPIISNCCMKKSKFLNTSSFLIILFCFIYFLLFKSTADMWNNIPYQTWIL